MSTDISLRIVELEAASEKLKEVFNISQLLEVTLSDRKYKIATTVLIFQDDLPQDYMKTANIMATRTNGSQTMSVKTALMTNRGTS